MTQQCTSAGTLRIKMQKPLLPLSSPGVVHGLTSELPRQAVQTNPSGLHSDRLLAGLLASLLIWMISALRATVVVLALLILCLASRPAEAGLWRQQREQPSFTTVPARIAAKGQGKAPLPSYALSPG